MTFQVWEYRQVSSSANNGGGFVWTSLVNSTYKWTVSASGTNEYYVELAAGGDPSLTEAKSVFLDGNHNLAANGTVGSLAVSEWDWGDNDTLGYSTIYVRLADGVDPDNKPDDFVGFGGGGGQDYSQQGAAQLALTDLATSGIGVKTVTSATGGFTALMVDNYIQIRSGTNVSAGFYLIDGFSDTNTITVTVAPDDGVGGVSGGSGNVGGALDVLLDSFFDGAGELSPFVAFDIIYGKSDGTMTLTGSVRTNLDIGQFFGYDTTRGDAPTGSGRLAIAVGANQLEFDNDWIVKYVIITGTGVNILRADEAAIFEYCKSTNSSGSAGRNAFTFVNPFNTALFCEGISTLGDAFSFVGDTTMLKNCYAHDSDTGMLGTAAVSDTCTIEGSTIANCTTYGIRFPGPGAEGNRILSNTIYDCGTGISFGDDCIRTVVINNIISGNTIGMSMGSNQQRGTFRDFNLWNNTTDVVKVVKGPNAVTGDPLLNDPENGDFTLQSASPAIDAGADANLAGATV